MAINVNRTVRLQWKWDTIKNCTYLQCGTYEVSKFADFAAKGNKLVHTPFQSQLSKKFL